MSYDEMLKAYKALDSSERKQVDDLLRQLTTRKRDILDEAIPLFGIWKGQIKMSPDFDAPMEEFKDYM